MSHLISSFKDHRSSTLRILFAFFIAGGCYACNALGEPIPEGRSGNKADALAERMLKAIDYEAWDSTRYVRWSMIGRDYFWDKKKDRVRVRWSDRDVLLDLNDQSGIAHAGGRLMKGEEKKEALQQAWAYFCNDSFWLNAPAKVFDPGTERRLVRTEEGDQHLLVTYTSGGVTPGDSYLWILDENGRPERFKMWVSKIPIGGVEAGWEAWDTLSTGARIATSHELAFFTLRIENLKAGQTLEIFGSENAPFEMMKEGG